MSGAAELRQIVAQFLEIDAAALRPETAFGARFSTSLARAGLDAALRRRLGVKCDAVYIARRYADLESAVLGTAYPDAADSPTPAPPVPTTSARDFPELAVQCGVDIVDIDELPEANDYWEHDFYRNSFSDAEIAYCLTQPSPREHFAARWAAKEAAKKLAPEYLQAELRELEVAPRRDGAPALKWRGAVLPIALSLSHTRTAAVAMAVAVPPAADAARVEHAAATPTEPAAPQAAQPRKKQRRLQWIAVAGLLIAAAYWAWLKV